MSAGELSGVGFPTPASATWMTPAQAADRLQVPVTTLAQWAVDGEGPQLRKFGGRVRYRSSDVDAWADDQDVRKIRTPEESGDTNVSPPQRLVNRLLAAAEVLDCLACKAEPKEPCRNVVNGEIREWPHIIRLDRRRVEPNDAS